MRIRYWSSDVCSSDRALISFCLEAAAIMAHVPPEARRGLRGYARDVGLAFQIAADLLDVEGAETRTGKALHKDADAGKETFVSLLGVERERGQNGSGSWGEREGQSE